MFRKKWHILIGLLAMLVVLRIIGVAPGQILRRRLEQRREERQNQAAANATVSPRGAASCGSELNLGFHLQTFSTGLRAAVWYPAKQAEASFHYADGLLSALAENAPAADCGEYPMVVFSHGFGGCGTQSVFFTEALARAGYIVVAPDHQDAGCKVDQPRERGLLLHRAEEPFRRPGKWDDSTYRDRRQDIEIVLNEMPDDPLVGRSLDRAHIGGAGHSLGGYTIAGLSGAWPSWKDSRIKASLLLSPYIKPYSDKATLRSMNVPVMYQGGTRDITITPSVARTGGAYAQSNPPKFFVEFFDAGHLGWTVLTCKPYGSAPGCDEQAPLARLINQYGIAFFDRYLKGRPAEILDRPNRQLADFRYDETRHSD
jgi:predicted dienelactone hydrolase